MRVSELRQGRPALARVLVVVSLAGLSAGCSSTSRFTDSPLFAGSSAQPGGPIAQADLKPLAQPTAYAAGAASNSLRERGWSVEGAPIVEVSATDTASTLSAGFGVPVSVILEANGLTNAEQVRPGQRLVIPTYVRVDNPTAAVVTAAATPAPAPAVPLQAGESRHIVQSGDTLDRLAGAYRVPATEIARINGLAPGTGLAAGGALRIPPATPSAGPAPQMVAEGPAPAFAPPAEQTLAPPAGAAVDAPDETQVAALTPATASPTMTDAPPDVQDDGGTGFRWPVRGRIITGFGKQADGARNDGINLAVPAGTPVRAAEEGTVIYAGSELEGYGNLILIQHKDDWVSAYAHNSELKVKRGEKVQRGQTISAVGKSGSVDQPQLHFELRRKSKPVDPLPQLSGGA